ncbi:MAG TPA: diguanylate cyclase [Acidimicrobiia bacterium]|nr:diguanylate cyclase [Acidimicrobiia bacterium]
MEVGSTGRERPLRLLLVEDSRTDAELVEALLEHRDDVRFSITVAGSLADGLAWLARHSVDVVLLDLTLPDSERLETFRAVRNRAPTVPVVVMTGVAETGLGQAAVQQGAQDFLIKGPLTSDRLAETLLFAIERARLAGRHSLRDPLTGLATAPLLDERVIEGLARAEREKRYVAVLVVGLGDFAAVDIRFGPNAGEELLFGIAERLCEVFAPPAALGRIGVDEFAVVLEGLARPSNAERAAQRVLGTLAPEFKLGVDKLRVAVCIGIALGRVSADGPTLVERARAAMLEQRRSGEQGVRMA